MTVEQTSYEPVTSTPAAAAPAGIPWGSRVIPLLLVLASGAFLLAGMGMAGLGGMYLAQEYVLDPSDSGGCMGAEVTAVFLVFCGSVAGVLGVVQAIIAAVLFFTFGRQAETAAKQDFH